MFIAGDLKIAVQHRAGRGMAPIMQQVHQREAEIIEYVDRRNHRIELDGVEQHRMAIDHHDVFQMQIAMAAPHLALAAALFQQRLEARERGAAFLIECRGSFGIEIGRNERGRVAGDDAFDRGDPGCVIGARRAVMRGRDHIGDFLQQRVR